MKLSVSSFNETQLRQLYSFARSCVKAFRLPRRSCLRTEPQPRTTSATPTVWRTSTSRRAGCSPLAADPPWLAIRRVAEAWFETAADLPVLQDSGATLTRADLLQRVKLLASELDDEMFQRRDAVGQLQRFLAVVVNGDFERVLRTSGTVAAQNFAACGRIGTHGARIGAAGGHGAADRQPLCGIYNLRRRRGSRVD